MGNIVSKLKNYLHTKVENTKLAIRTKVDNTKNAICTRVDNTKQAIVGAVTNTRDAIYRKVINTKNGIQNRINAAADAVFTSVNNVRDGITTRITNTVNGVCNVKNAVVTKCVNTKNGVVTRCRNTKNAVVTKYKNGRNGVVTRYTNTRDSVVTRYTNSRDYIYDNYRRAREAKLTRYEKLKYSSGFLVGFFMFTLTLLTFWDLYYENFDRIHDRNQYIWQTICLICDNLWYISELSLSYLYHGTIIVLEHLWFATQVLCYYVWEGTKLCAHHTWEGTKVTAAYIAQGSQIAWAYFSHSCQVAGQYLWHGAGVCWEYFVIAATVTWQYIVLGSKWGLHYSVEGSKLAAEYTVKGTKYALINGSIALKDGSIKTVQWAFYFLTNFRAASKEAAIGLYDASIYTGSCITAGSYHGSVMLWEGTQYTAVKGWEGTVMLSEGIVTVFCSTRDFITSGFQNLVYGIDLAAVTLYNGVIYSVVASCECIVWLVQSAYHCTLVSIDFLWTWSRYIVKTSSEGLYIAFNKYGLVWSYNAANKIANWSCTLGDIIWKFLTDLVTYVGNCLYNGGNQIYNAFYIIISFIYQMFSGTSRVIKASTGGIVYCVTSVFSAIIWVLEETIFAYNVMLKQYNMYREILFSSFLALLILYCTGLMRDRKRSLEERHGEESDSSSEEDEDEVDDSKPRLIPRKKDLQLPAYPENDKKHFPTYEEFLQEDEAQQVLSVVKPMLEDLLPPTDDEDEFDLEQNVPDFMDLSCSEPEPEPPDAETSDHDTEGIHDLSFGSRGSAGHDSSQEVPDVDNLPQSDDEQGHSLPTGQGHRVPQGQESGDELDRDLDSEVHSMNERELKETLQVRRLSDPEDDALHHELEKVDPGAEADAEDEDEDEVMTASLIERLDSIKRRKEEANSEERDQS